MTIQNNNIVLSGSNKCANVLKFMFYMSPFGYFYDPKKAKLYYAIWKIENI